MCRRAVAQAKAGAIKKNTWRLDRNVSWYGPGFYGKRTACGQAMTEGLVGVAHRTLPCGTRITFKNPANGRVVTAPVVLTQDTYFGPPVLSGPTIGLASANGGEETSNGKAGRKAAASASSVPEETVPHVPAGKGGKDDAKRGGVTLRVRGTGR